MSRQRVAAAVNAAEKLNDTLNAFLAIDREGALQRAENSLGPTRRYPDRRQRQHLRQRHAGVLWFENSWRLSSALQRDRDRAFDRCRRSRYRQD